MLPKLISYGDFFLPTYGVLVALGFLAALQLITRLAKERGMNGELLTNLAVYCALAGLAGAKIFMIAFDWRVYADNPKELFSVSTLQAAGVFQGGLLLAMAVAWWYVKRHRLSFLVVADLFAPALALGHAIGRLGCFAAGCCWGDHCERPWAVTFRNPEAERLTGVPLGVPLHPTQLYESAAEFLLCGFLLWWWRRKQGPPGQVFSLYLLIYSVVRFTIEFFRFHAQGLPFGMQFSLTQWIAMGTFLMGAAMFARRGPAPAPAQ